MRANHTIRAATRPVVKTATLHYAVPVRTVGEQSYRIKELKLRFYHCQNMFAPRDEVGQHMLEENRSCMEAAHSSGMFLASLQDANTYLDSVLSASASRVPTDEAPDVPLDVKQGTAN